LERPTDIHIIKRNIRIFGYRIEGEEMPRTKESFESRMKKLRLTRGLSLKQRADETGYHSKYLKEIEKGLVIPPVSAIIQIAKAFSVKSGTFLLAEQQRASKERKSFFIRTEAYAYQPLISWSKPTT
jgi:transcriptional regulator with XRE-family HTH domain